MSRNCNALSETTDLHVIFPPQWSPFQPFLSTPSLKAYLEARGHRVMQSDWNIGFYHYFLDKGRLANARGRLEQYARSLPEEHANYRARALNALANLEGYSALRAKMRYLQDPGGTEDVQAFREAVDAFYILLDAFSVAEPVVEVGTSSLSHPGVLKSFDSLASFITNGSENPFISYFAREASALAPPRVFGISIIGGEQVVPGLTLCAVLKERFPEVPIILGGSVFSRLVEKDNEAWRLFGKYFDYICRYEGEQPMDAFLSSSDPRQERTPNIAFAEGDQIVLTPLCEPLLMDEIPTPDFTGLPLSDYLAPEIVLPLLTTRGCYWGKCAFCYHGMIYQDRYRMRSPQRIADDVLQLNELHQVRHFAFNDEALPPKLFRLLPDVIPPRRFFFTALYKFEKVFTAEDYSRMHDIGFRSLYIGLETASERVQRHMKKNNLQSTMVKNLQGAHDAGIWNHTFVFFGFPTETEEEAEETIRFLLDHADIIHSEGTGTFSFEHNAPIHHEPSKFGVNDVAKKPEAILELYYDYEVTSGLSAADAKRVLERFTELKKSLGLYQDSSWIPREYLLLLLSRHGTAKIQQQLSSIRHHRENVASGMDSLSCFTFPTNDGSMKHFVVNRASGKVFETNEDLVKLILLADSQLPLEVLVQSFPALAVVA